jgi:hypothetical protein
METINISIVNLVGSSFCTDVEDGEKIYTFIKKAMEEKKKIKISFLNIELMTTAFLNTAIGQLYKDYTEEEIESAISVEDLSESGAVSLKRVKETAKFFYENPEAMQQSIEDILES